MSVTQGARAHLKLPNPTLTRLVKYQNNLTDKPPLFEYSKSAKLLTVQTVK
jgi:hypothetical protein